MYSYSNHPQLYRSTKVLQLGTNSQVRVDIILNVGVVYENL